MNWPAYNKSLVRRGEILLGFDVIDNWDTELEEMNKDKIGVISLSKYIAASFRICQGILSSSL
jgi:hypothetical protein